MTSLAHLDEEAVSAAIAEFVSLGRDRFLSSYNLKGSSNYFIRLEDGTLVDTKPIIAVAHAIKMGGEPLRGFNGGKGQAAPKLRAMGYKIEYVDSVKKAGTRVTRVPRFDLPALGEAYPNRTAVKETYGGDINAGIIRFPGDAIVNLFSDATGPYSDDPPNLLRPFGYRGAGQDGDQDIKGTGNARLEAARASQDAVRFWYRPEGQDYTFLTWAIVVGWAWTTGTDRHRSNVRQIEWQLQAVHSPDRDEWPPGTVAKAHEAEEHLDETLDAPEARENVSYTELIARVESLRPTAPKKQTVRINLARSQAAKRAVLLRAVGMCESPYCTGMPLERSRTGGPILDVDHVVDLALGGSDHPANMIAVCPNCHAAKTRGNTGLWRKRFLKVAVTADRQARGRVV